MQTDNKKIDLGWGHTPLISLWLKTLYGNSILPDAQNYDFGFDYLPYEGKDSVIENIKKFYINFLGIDLSSHKILLTEGASMAIYLLGGLLEHKNIHSVNLNTTFYTKSPLLLSDMNRRNFRLSFYDFFYPSSDTVIFAEIPNNPMGYLWSNALGNPHEFGQQANNVALDLAYFTPTYCSAIDIASYSPHISKAQYLIGSFGKMLGFNNLRIGFLAVKDEHDFLFLQKSIGFKTLGTSGLAQFVLNRFLEQNPKQFFEKTFDALYYQRVEIVSAATSKGIEVLSENRGMFVVLRVDDYLYSALSEKVSFLDGVSFGMPSINGMHTIRLNAAKNYQDIEGFVRILSQV